MDELRPTKDALRRRLRHWRRGFAQTESGRLASQLICRQVMALPQWRTSRVVALYQPLAGEVDVAALRAHGGRVCWPVVVEAGRALEWREGGDWRTGRLGVREPGPGARRVPPERIDLVVVPGVAFDRRGARLGQGGGYYDRSLPWIGGLRVGVAFAGQLVGEVPSDEHDQRVDVVITERGSENADGPAA